MEHEKNKAILAIDTADNLFEYINTYATAELIGKYTTFYLAFLGWNSQREKTILSAKQNILKLVTDHYEIKKAT